MSKCFVTLPPAAAGAPNPECYYSLMSAPSHGPAGPAILTCSGFVLAGGGSTRMGADKALLLHRGVAMVLRVAGEVARAAGDATLIGQPKRYAHLGLPVVADLAPGLGPVGGIATALAITKAEWNLVVACDMPGLEAGLLSELIDCARAGGSLCTAAAGPMGLEPLCAVYHRDAEPVVAQALADGQLKAARVLERLGARAGPLMPVKALENLNTQEEWQRFSHAG
jgi:molybdenum cofactor guanylyltransferase